MMGWTTITVRLLLASSFIGAVCSVPLRHGNNGKVRAGGIRNRVAHVTGEHIDHRRRFDDDVGNRRKRFARSRRDSETNDNNREPIRFQHHPDARVADNLNGEEVVHAPVRHGVRMPDGVRSRLNQENDQFGGPLNSHQSRLEQTKHQFGGQERLVNRRPQENINEDREGFAARDMGNSDDQQARHMVHQRRDDYVTDGVPQKLGNLPALTGFEMQGNVMHGTDSPVHARIEGEHANGGRLGNFPAAALQQQRFEQPAARPQRGHQEQQRGPNGQVEQEEQWLNHRQDTRAAHGERDGNALDSHDSENYAAGNGDNQDYPVNADHVIGRSKDSDVMSDGGEDQLKAVLRDITKLRQEMEQESEVKMLPPDHLVGMPLERDGDSNPSMHREAFFGKELGNMRGLSKSSTMRRLRQLFLRADANSDQQLDSTELAEWIHQRGLEHMNEAQAKNRADFNHVDRDRDQELTWNEYARHIQHMKSSDVQHHAPKHLSKAIWRDLQRVKNGNRVPVSDQMRSSMGNSTLQRLLVRDLQRWRNADNDNDMKLSEGEFFTFRHPEYNSVTLSQLVKELIAELDQNGDGQLTQDEYLSRKRTHNSKGLLDEGDGLEERRRQFTELIDVDSDGMATPDELEQFVDPLSAQSSINSALALVRRVDNDKNSKVSWDELVSHQDLFLDNNLNPIVRKTHNEL
eukprot:scpid39428/ scgid18221/ 45 kDa calcium-binding protein; Stromal cell-derived factor 4